MAKQTDEQKQRDRLIDELLKDYTGPESFWGQSGLFAQLKKKIIERSQPMNHQAILLQWLGLNLPKNLPLSGQFLKKSSENFRRF